MVRGNGKRKLAVFEDPNCGYCKRFERDLQKVDNVTVYMFLYPILSQDSADKSRNIWCAKDKAKAWTDWMVRDQPCPSRQRRPATCHRAHAQCRVRPQAQDHRHPHPDVCRWLARAGRHQRGSRSKIPRRQVSQIHHGPAPWLAYSRAMPHAKARTGRAARALPRRASPTCMPICFASR
jgi:hypothetical protein